MKRTRVLLGAAALVATTVLITSEVGSARQGDVGADMEKMKAEMMARMAELGAPGPEHKALAELAGKWTQTYKMKWDPTATAWDEAAGTSEAKTILDGRYVATDYQTNVKEGHSKGFQLLGFDKTKGEYTSLWATSSSTWWTTSSGKETAPGTVEMKGRMMTPVGESPFRSIIQNKSRDEVFVQMFVTYPGMAEIMTMEYTSKRVK